MGGWTTCWSLCGDSLCSALLLYSLMAASTDERLKRSVWPTCHSSSHGRWEDRISTVLLILSFIFLSAAPGCPVPWCHHSAHTTEKNRAKISLLHSRIWVFSGITACSVLPREDDGVVCHVQFFFIDLDPKVLVPWGGPPSPPPTPEW